jgi:hypothetical protein
MLVGGKIKRELATSFETWILDHRALHSNIGGGLRH